MLLLVAPHTGAWIETLYPVISDQEVLSRLTQARGLKHYIRYALSSKSVAPHTGAWIETSTGTKPTRSLMSRLTQARGLKLLVAEPVLFH